MEKNKRNIYFADYMDYSLENKGRNIALPFEQLTFDLLCFYPASIVLTLTSTLIGESTTRFGAFQDFWVSGALKIHLSKGDTADRYLSRKLASMSDIDHDNYEIKLYSSAEAENFVNKFLKGELSDRNIDYVFPRISNADRNNRNAFLENLGKNERAIIESASFPMGMHEFDRLAYRLETLADDASFTFQRSHIIHDLVEHKIFKDAASISNVLLSTFDASYNQAMARSIGAEMISTMYRQLNGVGLRTFVKGYSPKLYYYICSMSPTQVLLLAQDKNWQIFRSFICELFEKLAMTRTMTQSTAFYKETIKVETKNMLLNDCIERVADVAFDALKYANPTAYSDVQQTKMAVSTCLDYWNRKFSEVEYCSEQIIKRTKLIEQICEDILQKIYI